jgi:hypothetical protein
MPSDQPSETFRPVPGFPGYRVSDRGRAQCCRDNQGRLTDNWHDLKPSTRPGRPYFQISLYRDRKLTPRHVHHLVLELFVGPRPPGLVARHLDGNPHNNYVGNLAWGTVKENYEDARRHGTATIGERQGCTVLNAGLVRLIRRLAIEGWGAAAIARELHISKPATWKAMRRDTWRHVSP